jgi:hypothetical protein
MGQKPRAPDEDRDPPCPGAPDEAFPALDALLPWESPRPPEPPLPPPDLRAAPPPDPSAALPWEPAERVEESPSPLPPGGGELPAWLQPEEAEAALGGTNGTLLPLTELESLAEAELGPPDGQADGENPAGYTRQELARDQPVTEVFDSAATAIRLTVRTLPRPESPNADTPVSE